MDLSPDGTKLFMACGSKGVWQMDLADLKNPKGHTLTPNGWSGYTMGLKATTDKLLVAHYDTGLVILSGTSFVNC